MSKRKLLLRVFTVLLCITLLSVDFFASAVLFTFETQYDYDEADIAWLTDLVIKEDMTTVEGMAQRVDLIPVADYPYTETPDSFKNDVKYFTSLYNLDAGSQRAGYMYFFEILNTRSELLAADVSDADIREYLEGIGISYPSSVGSDELIMARALFTSLVSGSFSANSYASGASLEEVLVSYMSSLTGMNTETLKEWMPDSSLLSLDEYILAASKMTLWSNGYDVTADTPEDEVYRLIAVMTVKAQGISVDSELPFSELNLKYIAALLGQKYSVSIDSKKLGEAINNDSTAFYILQLIGRQNGVSVREDNATYEEAFEIVAENSDIFDVATDDFYADIFCYDAYLNGRCDSLWVYPTAYCTNNSSYSLTVSVNGAAVKNNYYNEIAISGDKDVQELTVEVAVSGNGKSSTCTYTVNVHQGAYADIEGDAPVTEPGSEDHSYVSSDSLVADVLSSLGLNSVISAVLDKSYVSLPAGLSGVVSFIAPTFEPVTGSATVSENTDDSFYISVLDEIGSVINTEIGGIAGIELDINFDNGIDSIVTFD